MQTLSINDNAKEMGDYFQNKLKEKIARKKTVKEIRGKGLMIGIELVNECINLAETALKSGLIINVTQDNIIRMLPPLIINRTQIDDIISILNKRFFIYSYIYVDFDLESRKYFDIFVPFHSDNHDYQNRQLIVNLK